MRQLRARPLLAWPGLHNLRQTLALAVLFGVAFYAMYGGACYITDLHTFRLYWHFEFEPRLPFVPALAPIYLSTQILLGMAPFVLRTREELLPLVKTLLWQTAIASALFIAFPLADGFSRPPSAEIGGFFFPLADAINLHNNKFPSLHVALALTTSLVYQSFCGWFGKGVFIAWASAIAVSTWLLHEHHLVDIVAGLSLAISCYHVLFKRLSRNNP